MRAHGVAVGGVGLVEQWRCFNRHHRRHGSRLELGIDRRGATALDDDLGIDGSLEAVFRKRERIGADRQVGDAEGAVGRAGGSDFEIRAHVVGFDTRALDDGARGVGDRAVQCAQRLLAESRTGEKGCNCRQSKKFAADGLRHRDCAV